MRAAGLTVDPIEQVAEIQRFWRKVVKAPGRGCWIWTGAIGDDGYGSFSVRRPRLNAVSREPLVDPLTGRVQLREFCISAPRYAMAVAYRVVLEPEVVAAHDVCDEPICVRAHPGVVDGGPAHVVPSTQAENLAAMGRRGRGGGTARPWGARGTSRAQKVQRSRAIRAVVRVHGWDESAVAEALARLAQADGQMSLF